MDVETAKQIFSAGEYLEQDGKIAEAIACYQQATKLHPEQYQYHYKLGVILRQDSQITESIKSFNRAIKLNQAHSWSYHALGELHTENQELDLSIECYQKAIEFNPNFSWSHYNLGRIYHQQGLLNKACNCYQQAIEIEADFAWSHYFLAEVLKCLQKRELAVVHYQKAIDLNPNFHEAYYALGRDRQIQQELNKAAYFYRQAIAIEPQIYVYYYHLGETLVESEKFIEAIACCEKAIALQINSLQAYYYLGKALIHQGKDAISDYREQNKERSPVFLVNLEVGLAQAWQQSEQFERSIECCKRAIEIDPTAEIPFKILQYIPTNMQQIDALIDFYRQTGKFNRVCPLLWGNLGDLLTKQSKITEAIDCYRTGCYENTIAKKPQLSRLNWQYAKQNPPDFIIIGATKSGTTSLFQYLDGHSQVLAPHRKEINFFNRNFHLDKSWYLANFPAIADAPEYITGEASASYLYDDQVISRIKQLFPQIKLIAMLRNPIERTISDYYHAWNHGLEKRSLSKLIEIETERLKVLGRSKAMEMFGYLTNSIYVEQITKWIDAFGKKNILIIKSESFFEDTASVMQEVYQFLDLDYQTLEHHIPYNVGTYPDVEPELRQRLADFFTPFNLELEEYLGRKFYW
ncbi:MAG: tetratricopeptide repeat protein [Cyanobacteria bacterium P01_G01_bin.19]